MFRELKAKVSGWSLQQGPPVMGHFSSEKKKERKKKEKRIAARLQEQFQVKKSFEGSLSVCQSAKKERTFLWKFIKDIVKITRSDLCTWSEHGQ
ncbi:hypothetical protein ACN38_g10672 [Penicillium nordicum]|uniref:Uncharacterized protein n=1 Tax=Penicillium nordicum TaxID=229535 RepID=A0A0M9WBL4_9EURO|nr:hypothetical protein ACN38_g10672 [Penicillium nordicum]